LLPNPLWHSLVLADRQVKVNTPSLIPVSV
jgi:hypothetical protein